MSASLVGSEMCIRDRCSVFRAQVLVHNSSAHCEAICRIALAEHPHSWHGPQSTAAVGMGRPKHLLS
eukprot:2730264-Alexandrium_andersonii.AAC.1